MNIGPGTAVVTLAKGTERYVFIYANRRWKELPAVLEGLACDPDLSFDHYDADGVMITVRGNAGEA